MIFRYVFFLLFALITGLAKGQVNVKDSTQEAWVIPVKFGFHIPLGDNADRFGSDFSIGTGLSYKFKSNWTLSVHGAYIFGDDVVLRNQILDFVSTSSGQVLGLAGDFTTVKTFQRGFYVGANFGKIFPKVLGHNPNSGLQFQLGAGYLQNKIRIENPGDVMPQFQGDYLKGYDHLHNGLGLYQYVGFYHAGNDRKLNFTIGIESMMGLMKSVRGYNYDSRSYDIDQKFDWYLGLNIGWFLPFYNENSQKYYYY
ncbi:MAG: hypothetical protein LPK80_11970 [Bacteroidota bacterium]|nr:hypothetical protein [Bacteroidota bacterium]MDX5429000.1 hypothetical protein [Bacteroidota bacterium]MDX5506664.1 hypothetical protein [Bacteroidota bacterium]